MRVWCAWRTDKRKSSQWVSDRNFALCAKTQWEYSASWQKPVKRVFWKRSASSSRFVRPEVQGIRERLSATARGASVYARGFRRTTAPPRSQRQCGRSTSSARPGLVSGHAGSGASGNLVVEQIDRPAGGDHLVVLAPDRRSSVQCFTRGRSRTRNGLVVAPPRPARCAPPV